MKKITAFLLLVCMLVGVFGNSTIYAASTSYKFNNLTKVQHTQRAYIYGGEEGICEYCTTFSLSGMTAANYSLLPYQLSSGNFYIFIISDEAFTGNLSISTAGEIIEESSHYPEFTPSSSSEVKTIESIELNGMYYAFCTTMALNLDLFNTVSISYLKLPDSVTFKTAPAYVIDLFKTYKGDLTQCDDFIMNFDIETATYDENLGSLKNIKRYAIKYTDGGSASTGTIDYTWKYTYASTTTTGFDLSTDGASVQYIIKKKGGYKTLLGDYFSLPTVTSDYFLAESGKKYFYISSDTLNSLVKSFRTSDVPLSATLDFTDYVYLRPVFFNGTNYSYGNWSRTYVSDKGSLIIENGTTDGDGGAISSEDDGDDDDFTPNGETDESSVGTGDGTSLEDAEDNLIDSLSDFSSLFTNFINELTALQESLGKIPALIGNVFTAFPDGVITAIGLGFIIVIFLRVLGR